MSPSAARAARQSGTTVPPADAAGRDEDEGPRARTRVRQRTHLRPVRVPLPLRVVEQRGDACVRGLPPREEMVRVVAEGDGDGPEQRERKREHAIAVGAHGRVEAEAPREQRRAGVGGPRVREALVLRGPHAAAVLRAAPIEELEALLVPLVHRVEGAGRRQRRVELRLEAVVHEDEPAGAAAAEFVDRAHGGPRLLGQGPRADGRAGVAELAHEAPDVHNRDAHDADSLFKCLRATDRAHPPRGASRPTDRP